MRQMRSICRFRALRERASVSQALLSRWGAAVFPDTIRKLAAALGVKPEELVEETARR